MPITRSAKKAHRQSLRRRKFNSVRKNQATEAVKAFKKLVASKDKKGAEKLLPLAQKALDKAVKTSVIPANTASRRKAQLSKLLKSL